MFSNPIVANACQIFKKKVVQGHNHTLKSYNLIKENKTIVLPMIKQKEITLDGYSRGYYLITSHIERELGQLPDVGLLNILVKHTSAGISLNENADPSVREDFKTFIDELIPENHPNYTHTFEGSDDMPAHLKSSLIGASVTIPITNGRLNLGTWQGIYFCEFRNRGGRRKLVLTIYY